ncbi:MAG: thioredoxin family protein [Acidobacteriota bacterium]
MARPRKVPINRIDLRESPCPRSAGVNPDVVEEYVAHLQGGGSFPPVTLFTDGNVFWVADGRHRISATVRVSGKDGEDLPDEVTIDAVVRDGTLRDCLLYAVGANAEHGFRRSNADKRHAVELVLGEKSWAGKTDSWIAQACKVSHTLVAKVRSEVAASTCNVSSQSPVRVGRDGRAINVQNIGKKKSDLRSVTDATFDAEVLKSGRPVVVFFFQPGCAPCDYLDTAMRRLRPKFAQYLAMSRMDVSTKAAIASRLGINGTPTFHLYRNGKLEAEQIGSIPVGALERMLKAWAHPDKESQGPELQEHPEAQEDIAQETTIKPDEPNPQTRQELNAPPEPDVKDRNDRAALRSNAEQEILDRLRNGESAEAIREALWNHLDRKLGEALGYTQTEAEVPAEPASGRQTCEHVLDMLRKGFAYRLENGAAELRVSDGRRMTSVRELNFCPVCGEGVLQVETEQRSHTNMIQETGGESWIRQ